jgi:Trk K+ transport system NAD-binding subunit
MRSVKVDRDLGRRTLAELALPRRFGCTVLAVVSHDPDGRERRLPASAEQTLSRGDRLIVVGPSPSIDNLTEALLPPTPAATPLSSGS